MKIIVGLGNPGKEYAETRHNVGFMCLDSIQKALEFPEFKQEKKLSSSVSEGMLSNEKLLLLKPQTFMNLSGNAVATAVNFYKVKPEEMWIIYDDIDLPLGSIRIRKGGSSGSHNGMKSILAELGINNFPRLRIGIESRGVSSPKEQDISLFVLQKFQKSELPILKEILKKASSAILTSLEKGLNEAMQRFNGSLDSE